MDSLLRYCITVIVVMPTGVNANHTVAVKGGGMVLEIGAKSP